MYRNRFLIAVLLVLILLASSVSAQEPVTVRIFVGLGTGTQPTQIAAQEALAERFNSEHDDIQIEFVIVPTEEARTRLQAMIAGGNAPELVGPHGISTIAQFLDLWADITPFIEADGLDTSDFYELSLQLNAYPEKNTGLPLGLFPSFILYNADLFDAYGVDYPTASYDDESWTIDAMTETAMLLTIDENGNNATSPDFDPDAIVQWGFSDAWSDGRGRLAMWGAPDIGRPTNADYTTATANSEQWVAGLQWLSDGLHVDHFIAGPDGEAAFEVTGLGTPLDGGLLAMFHSHTWYLTEVAETFDDLQFNLQIAPVPFNPDGGRVARIHADNFTIPDAAENKEAAWEVMKWLTSEDVIVDVCLIYGCIPARQSVADEFEAVLGDRFPGLDYSIIFEAINYLDDPNHESWVPEWGRVNDVMNFAYDQVFTGQETDAQTVLDAANEEIQGLLDEYNAE
jgi:multiple sugar transport system substrate-binding protein